MRKILLLALLLNITGVQAQTYDIEDLDVSIKDGIIDKVVIDSIEYPAPDVLQLNLKAVDSAGNILSQFIESQEIDPQNYDETLTIDVLMEERFSILHKE